MKKYKILFVSTKAITQNTFFDSFINNSPFDLTLACSDTINLKFKKKKIRLNFKKNIIYFFNFFALLYELLDIRKKINNKFDLVIINNPLAAFYLRLALIFSNQKIMYFVHGYRFHSAEKNMKYFIFFYIEKFFSKFTDYFININLEDYIITKNKFGKKNSEILRLPSVGIDFKKLKRFKSKKRVINYKIGVIAAYRDNKGYKDLIELSEFLANKKPNVKIICYGYDNPDKYKKIIKSKNLKNIIFNSFKKNIYREYQKFDFLCHLSKREGLPVSILESLYFGLPVICYNIRGNNDLVKNNFNGFLIKPYKLKIFKNKLLKIFSCNNKFKILKKNALKSISEIHEKKNVNKLLNNFIIHACRN